MVIYDLDDVETSKSALSITFDYYPAQFPGSDPRIRHEADPTTMSCLTKTI